MPFLFKQWGEWEAAYSAPSGQGWKVIGHDGQDVPLFPRDKDIEPFACVRRIGKKTAGRLLDGREHNEFPSPARAEATA